MGRGADFRLRVRRRWWRRRARRVLRTCASVGTGTEAHRTVRIIGGSRIHLGHNVWIGENAFIRGSGGLTIGDNTIISRNLVLYTTNHNHRGLRLPYDEVQVERPVSIGRNVWIGMNVCIAPGTTIGDGAIVGMGTVVHGDVPSMSIIGAPSWQIVGERDPEHYHRLDEAGAYGGRIGQPL